MYTFLGVLALCAFAAADLLASATAWAINLLGIQFVPVADLVSTFWMVVAILALLGDATWSVTLRLAAFAQGTVLLAAIFASLVLIALWLRLLQGYQGARASHP